MQAKIDVYSHYFTVSECSPELLHSLYGFSKHLVQWTIQKVEGRFQRAPSRKFYVFEEQKQKYRFHIGFFKNFKNYLKNVLKRQEEEFEWVFHSYPTPIRIDVTTSENFTPYENQVPAIEYLTDLDNNNPAALETNERSNRKFISIQTGGGKGLISIFATAAIGETVAIIIKPMYLQKWYLELIEKLNIEPEDVVIVSGSTGLKRILKSVKEDGERQKYYLFSNATIRNWITLYEENQLNISEEGYVCNPDDLNEVLGAGVRVIDELHQDFYFNFKLDLYTNIHSSISLTATFVSDDAFITRIHSAMHPLLQRYKGEAYNRYCASISFRYRFKVPQKIRCVTYGMNSYNHNEFEESVSRHVPTCMRYMAAIKYAIDSTFIQGYKPGYKLMVFCGTVKFCTMLTAYLRNKYHQFNVQRYCASEGDPYTENLMDADIRVSTLKSAGTAIDIPNLYVTIQSTALSSTAGNLQSLGRLRAMKDGTTPIYVFMSCEDIDKHMEYDAKKCEILKDKAASFGVMYYPEPI